MSDPRPRHFTMIRSFRLADLITLLNGFLGAGAVLAFMRFIVDRDKSFFWLATALLPVALLMDALDGRIARLRGVASALGQELDSLADVVSFGVAPAAMGFAVGLRGGWDALCLVYFVGCGISRLARYNVTASELSGPTGKVTHFEGFPIPTSLILVALLAIFAGLERWQDRLPLGVVWFAGFRLHLVSVLYVLHGSAMISKTLVIPKP